MVQVAACAGADDQQQGAGGGHDGGEGTGQQETGHDGGQLGQGQHGHDILCTAAGQGAGIGEDHTAGHAQNVHAEGQEEAEDAADQGDQTDRLLILDGHGLDDQVGLAHIAHEIDQGDAGDHQGGTLQIEILAPQGGQAGVDGIQALGDAGEAAGGGDAHGDQHGQTDEHEDGLHKVGVGHGQIAAGTGVDQHYHTAHQHGYFKAPAGDAGEQHADGQILHDQADDHGHQHDDDGQQLHALAVIPVAEEVGDGQGLGFFRIPAHPPGDDAKVQQRAEHVAGGGPQGGCARFPAVLGTGDVHAAAHRAGAVGQGGDPGAHLTAAYEPVLGTLYPSGRPQADEQHQGHIGDQDDGNLHRDGFADRSFQFSNTHRYFPLSYRYRSVTASTCPDRTSRLRSGR